MSAVLAHGEPPVVVRTATRHKCWVRSGLRDHHAWFIACQWCGFVTTTRDRSSALDDALNHWYFSAPEVTNAR